MEFQVASSRNPGPVARTGPVEMLSASSNGESKSVLHMRADTSSYVERRSLKLSEPSQTK